jgi:hypothetical protein
MSNTKANTATFLITMSLVAASVAAVRKLAARSNTQVHRINQK